MGTRASRMAGVRNADHPASSRRSARKPSSLKRKAKTAFALFTLLVLTSVAVLVVYCLFLFVQVSKSVPSLADIGEIKAAEGTKIYYADGSLMAVLANENRQPKKLSEISKYLIDATIATEDARFYEHRGVDVHGIARAIFRNASGGEMRQGASTITQQLARNLNELGLGREKKLRRKVAEAILAMRIEQTYSKDEILELYLNQIPYGHGAYGAESAARTYFHKSAKNLTLAEASYLAGIPQRPAYYSNDREAALKRRDQVLLRMVETGKITARQRDEVKAQTLKINRKFEASGTRIYGAPYVVNYVMQQLEHEYGSEAVYSGWRVYTTIHPLIQNAAEETLKNGIHHYGESANQAALVSIDPKTGYIRALVGGLDFKKNQYNIITQGLRQPGSSFKPIVYIAAFDNDVCDLEKTYHDDPHFEGEREGNTWHPQNFGGKHYGTINVETALKHSVNTIAVKVACETGLDKVIEYARRLGITTIDPSRDKYPPMALGAASVRPIELATAYCVMANDGKRPTPIVITKVVDGNGDTIKAEETPQVEDTHLKPETLSQINQALREVVLHGTGIAAADVPDARGKTGTTSDSRDAWFAGYTPDLVTIIWAGHEQRDKKGRYNYLPMEGTTGGHLCAPTWRDFMLKAVPIQQASIQNAARAAGLAKPHGPTESMNLDEKHKTDAKKPVDSAKPTVAPTGQAPSPPGTPPADPAANPAQPSPDSPPATPSVGAAPPQTGAAQPVAALARPSTPSFQPATRTVRTVDSVSRMSEPTGRIAAPPVHRSDPMDEYVTVRICGDTGLRANGPWCPATIERRVRRRDIPRRCNVHRAPPGEG